MACDSTAPIKYPELEIGLEQAPFDESKDYRAGAVGYNVRLQLTDPENAEQFGQKQGRCTIDHGALADSDGEEYGRKLASQVFSNEALREYFEDAKKYVLARDRRPLRVKVFVDESSSALYELRWELLADPVTHSPIATDRKNFLFSRFISSQDWSNIRLRTKRKLKALIAEIKRQR